MKILCYVNHFFGQSRDFTGKSSLPLKTNSIELERRAQIRKGLIEQTIQQLKKIGDVDLKICGIEGSSLVPLDLNFERIKNSPLLLIYETLNHMAHAVDDYDYFINIEDDVFLPEEAFNRIVEFDKISLINEIFLPNRLEKKSNGELYCVDLMSFSGWTQQRKKFENHDLRVAFNPHSAILIMSREKFKYALQFVDKKFRKPFLFNELDSAFAYFHAPFALFRSEMINFHYIIHLDKWLKSPGEADDLRSWKNVFSKTRLIDFVPPILARLYWKLSSDLKNRTS